MSEPSPKNLPSVIPPIVIHIPPNGHPSDSSRGEWEGVEGSPRGAEGDGSFHWIVDHGQRRNYARFGAALAEANSDLYCSDSGVVYARPGKIKAITTAKALASLTADSLTVKVVKDGKVIGDMISAAHLNAMLGSETFLDNFPVLRMCSTLPIYLDDFTLSEPGYKDGFLYLGEAPTIAEGMKATDTFLDVMPWASNADRTNAVAAALTVLLRHRWPGEKPVVLVTGTKSHCGKGTVTDYFTGKVPAASLLYENLDWPMQQQLQRQLRNKPETGVILLDNVRQDSSGRARFIRSGFLESLITSPEIDLAAPGAGEATTWKNHFVPTINSNDGTFSPDLLNRSLLIGLAPQGDVPTSSPIGNPKLEYLPAHQQEIEAELRGMIERWRVAGQPLDNNVKHPMTRWARTVGGILAFAGYKDFLANYQTSRIVADPVKEALAILAAATPANQWKRPAEWAVLAVKEGLVKTLISPNERDTERGRERAMGVLLSKHLGETFDVVTENASYRVKLAKQKKRWDKGQEPHTCYAFELVEEKPEK